MKKTVIRIFALLLAAIMVLSLGVTAFAAEMDKAFGSDGFLNESFDGIMAESAQNASSGGSDLGIFCVQAVVGSETVYLNAFLLEIGGNVYLVCDCLYAEPLSQSTLTLLSSGNGGYKQKLTMLGSDDYFVYFSASGVDSFAYLTVASQADTQGTLYFENGGQELKGVDMNISNAPAYELNSGEILFLLTDVGAGNLFVGAPFVKLDTNEVIGVGSIGVDGDTKERHLAICTIQGANPDTKFSLGSVNGGNSGDGGGGGSTETEPSNNGGGNSGNNGGGNSGNGGGGNSGGFEFKPIYLLYIGVVAVVVFLIVRSNTRGGDAGAKPGTVALERTDAVQGGETLPLDPIGGNQGTLPLDPNFNPMPVMTAWQLRAVGGSFNGQTFPISGTLRLGRAPQCQVVFPAGTPGISSNHCEVAMEGGSVVLRDLGSSYGTFCKGNKLAPHATCYLNPGDTFTMAQSQTFQLEAAGAAAPVQSAAPIAVRDSQGREYRTGSGRMAFGRASGNKVQFPADDKSVSSNHCVLYREGGKLFLMDVGSTNGTFINEKERLQPNVPYRVRKGMVFFLTNRKNTFVVVED